VRFYLSTTICLSRRSPPFDDLFFRVPSHARLWKLKGIPRSAATHGNDRRASPSLRAFMLSFLPCFHVVILTAVSNANGVEAALAVLSVAKELRPRRDPSLRSGRPKRPSRTAAELASRPEDQRDEGSSSRASEKPVPVLCAHGARLSDEGCSWYITLQLQMREEQG
jgi:hypothetical protein